MGGCDSFELTVNRNCTGKAWLKGVVKGKTPEANSVKSLTSLGQVKPRSCELFGLRGKTFWKNRTSSSLQVPALRVDSTARDGVHVSCGRLPTSGG